MFTQPGTAVFLTREGLRAILPLAERRALSFPLRLIKIKLQGQLLKIPEGSMKVALPLNSNSQSAIEAFFFSRAAGLQDK